LAQCFFSFPLRANQQIVQGVVPLEYHESVSTSDIFHTLFQLSFWELGAK